MFEIGPAVTGDDFIGREDYINKILRYMRNKKSISIYGLARIGKSSIVDEIIRRINNNEIDYGEETPFFYKFSFTRDVRDRIHLFEGFYSFLQDCVASVSLGEDKVFQRYLQRIDKCIKDKDISYQPYSSLCDEIYKKTGRSIWIVLDEMDYANESLGVYIDKIRELINSSKESVRSINVSRHSMASIFPLGSPGSNYPGIVSESVNVIGFDEKDMLIFKRRAKTAIDTMDDSIWDKMQYYTGNIPVLIATFLNAIEECESNSFEEYVNNAKDRLDNYIKYWIDSIYDMKMMASLRKYINNEPTDLKLLKIYGLIDNDKLAIPYLGQIISEANTSHSESLYDSYIKLLPDIEMLMETSKSKSSLSVIYDDYSKKKLQRALNDLIAIKTKIEYCKSIKDLESIVKIDISVDEYNTIIQRLNEINHLIGGLSLS